jgi:LAO/AO transport system kinase
MVDPVAIAAGVVAFERSAIAAALNLVEDRRPEARADIRTLLSRLRSAGPRGRGHRVGVTGPPGVGKSTLVAAVTKTLRAAGDTVGVVAIDPTSVRSGGALLGDRTRIAPDPADKGVFVRSLASSGELGGLAPSVPLSVLVLSAAFDVSIVETVGIGQSETDVRHVVDTLVFVVQPGSGDSLQYMKAGIMEIPDLLVVNKADLELASRTRLELKAALASLRSAGIAEHEVPLVSTSAVKGDGVTELVTLLRRHGDELVSSGELSRRRRDGAIAWGASAFLRLYGERGVDRIGGEGALRDLVGRGVDAGQEVIEIIDALSARCAS